MNEPQEHAGTGGIERDGRGRFAQGCSGNPGGRPKGGGLKAEIEAKLGERVAERSRETRLVHIAEILVAKAEEGDLRALELILKRLWPERLAVEKSGECVTTLVLRDYSGLDAEEKAAIEQVRERRKREGRGPGMPEAAPRGSVVVTTGLEAYDGVGKGRSQEGPPLLPAGPRNGPETDGPTPDVTPKPDGEPQESESDRWRSV